MIPETPATVTAGLKRRLKRVRLVVCDVDGVLTDGGLYCAEGGGMFKRFDVHDGLGIVEVQRIGIPVVWLSGDTSAATAARAERLGVRDVRQGVENKATALEAIARDHRVSPDEFLYIGDDRTDLEAMQQSGLSVAVASAVPEVRAAAGFTTRLPGGYGAVREVLDLLLAQQ